MAFAMASVGHDNRSLPDSTFIFGGKSYHRIGDLLPRDSAVAAFAQIYMLDAEESAVRRAAAVGNNDSCKIARVSANEAENVITNQVLTLLRKPEFIVNTIGQAVGKISENLIINSFKQIEKVWDELFPLEQARIVSLLIKDITISPNGLNIRILKEGLHSLSNELNS